MNFSPEVILCRYLQTFTLLLINRISARIEGNSIEKHAPCSYFRNMFNTDGITKL